MKQLLFISVLMLHFSVRAQSDKLPIFERLTAELTSFQVDTTEIPNDKLSAKIRKFRALKGGFNVNEAMEFKIAESLSKSEISQSEYESLRQFISAGNGRKWLDNAVIHIYRKHFTVAEMNRMIRFYKTSAGQKMAADFPMIMIKSVKAAEFVIENYKKN